MPRPAIALILVLAACAPGRGIPIDPRPAFAHASCAPWDGGAVRIVLSQETDTLRVLRGPPAAGLELGAYTGIANAVGHEFRVDAEGRSGDGRTGGAVRCERGECVSANSGVIRLEARRADSILIGSYAVGFPDGTRQQGRFAARWLAARPLCG